ncbi:MAG TPA: hypothetical protein VGW38_17565, partial [Chloroflexota bacterium]|nr:hypothetical protein [Chloroflexota bacterium]
MKYPFFRTHWPTKRMLSGGAKVAMVAALLATTVGAVGAQPFDPRDPRMQPGFGRSEGPLFGNPNPGTAVDQRFGYGDPVTNFPQRTGINPGLATTLTPTTVDEILDNPGAFVGLPVVVTGEVGDLFGVYGFTLEDNDVIFDDSILVVGAAPWARIPGFRDALRGNNQAQIRGIVRWFDVRNVQAELGGVYLDEQDFVGFGGEPVIVAVAADFGNGLVTLTPNAIPARGAIRPGTQTQLPPRPGLGLRTGFTPLNRITSAPNTFYGSPVAVNATVRNVFDPQVFTLTAPGVQEEVLVISTSPAARLASGQAIGLAGTVQQFTPALGTAIERN